jgi:hypothetical protein
MRLVFAIARKGESMAVANHKMNKDRNDTLILNKLKELEDKIEYIDTKLRAKLSYLLNKIHELENKS